MAWSIKKYVPEYDESGSGGDDYDLIDSVNEDTYIYGSRKNLLAAANAVIKYFNKQDAKKPAKKKEKQK